MTELKGLNFPDEIHEEDKERIKQNLQKKSRTRNIESTNSRPPLMVVFAHSRKDLDLSLYRSDLLCALYPTERILHSKHTSHAVQDILASAYTHPALL